MTGDLKMLELFDGKVQQGVGFLTAASIIYFVQLKLLMIELHSEKSERPPDVFGE